MSVPASRLLSSVLRQSLRPESGSLRLVLGTVGAAITPATTRYLNVIVEGQTVRVPRLSDSGAANPGEPAYLLVTDDFILYIGTVR